MTGVQTCALPISEILYNCADSLRALGILFYSFMPSTCEKLWAQLGADKSIGDLTATSISECSKWGVLPAGSKVIKGEILFPRLEKKE